MPTPPATDELYRERLRAPWWWYAVAVGVAVLLAAEFNLADPALDVVAYAVLIPASIGIVWWAGRSTLTVTRTELRIRDAHIPLRYVTETVSLDAHTLRRVIGREGDPLAFVSIRPWIGSGVQLLIEDEQDPTPYWIVSSRHPERLVEAVRSAQ